MKTINLKEIEKIANQFENDENLLSKELKRIQSLKCRIKKQKFKSTYQKEMESVLNYEQVLKEAKQLVSPKKKTVTTYSQDDVELLDYDETVKAIRSIQSKKTLTKFQTEDESENEEYLKACSIEKMLIEHREKLQPSTKQLVRRTDVQTIIETIEENQNLTNKQIVEMLKDLIK